MITEDFLNPIKLSLAISLCASILVFLVGLFVAYQMVKSTFRGKQLLEAFFYIPLILPPTVTGFILLVLLGRKSFIGYLFESLSGQTIVFTSFAAVLSSVVVSFPLVYQTLSVGFESVPVQLRDAARSEGATEFQVFRYIIIPFAWRSIGAAYLLGFARSLGEFGATIIVAGMIPGKTLTMTSAIYLAVENNQTMLAWLWSIGLILISFMMMLLIRKSVRN